MQAHQHMPETNRLSVITATIFLAYALIPFVDIPSQVISLQLPGFLFQLVINFGTIVSILVAILAAAGTDWLIQGHPTAAGTARLPNWLLPALTAWVIGVPLTTLEVSAQWWAVFALGGLLFVLVLLSEYIVVDPIEKLDVLMHFLTSREGERGIIFCKTKAAVNKLAKNLAINRFSSGALHGSLTQPIRDRIMEQFREGHINILVATDLAARGIDVKEISYVVNYHLPDVYEAYVHRSGRTARAGAKGLSLTVLQKEETGELADFQKELGINFTEFKKPDANSIEENNTFLWAKQIFKTKPNHEVSPILKDKIKTVFHHLTKDELIEKMLASYLLQNKNEAISKTETPVKKKR